MTIQEQEMWIQTTNIALNLGILGFDKAEAHLASENYLTLQARLSLTQSES